MLTFHLSFQVKQIHFRHVREPAVRAKVTNSYNKQKMVILNSCYGINVQSSCSVTFLQKLPAWFLCLLIVQNG